MIEWVVDPVTAWMGGYNRYIVELIKAVEEAMKARESEIEDWMKQNRVWTDRTGLARQSLQAKVFRDGLFIYITMYHGESVFYSKFLELYMVGGDPERFGILKPAIEYWGQILLSDLKGIVGE